MDMQDKELDRLFQQKLTDVEIQPSAQVWQGITAGLDTGKRRRIFMPFLSAAAGIILLITAGILFMPKRPVKVNAPHHSTQIAGIVKPAQPPVTVKPVVPPATASNKVSATPVIAPTRSLAQVNKTQTKNNLIQPAQQPIIDTKLPADAHTDQPLLANAPAVNYNVVKTAVRDSAAAIGPASIIVNNEKPQPALIAQVAAQPLPTAAKPAKKHRIRSLGDVFNVVIAAVDKRKDKIIEFSNTDEDDATITGVNLGILKVKKEK